MLALTIPKYVGVDGAVTDAEATCCTFVAGEATADPTPLQLGSIPGYLPVYAGRAGVDDDEGMTGLFDRWRAVNAVSREDEELGHAASVRRLTGEFGVVVEFSRHTEFVRTRIKLDRLVRVVVAQVI